MKIPVSKGYTGEVSAVLRDRKGADLSTATFKMMLVGTEEGVPTKADLRWSTPLVELLEGDADGVSRARVTLQVSGGTPGFYYAGVLFGLGPLSIPVLCWNEVVELT